MATTELSTGDYPMEARVRLGKKVRQARRAAGFRSQPALAEAASVSTRSIAKLEKPQGELPVGAAVLGAVARVLPGWTEDTPRLILEGGEPPPTSAQGSAESEEDSEESGHAESPGNMKTGDESKLDAGPESSRDEMVEKLELALATVQELLAEYKRPSG